MELERIEPGCAKGKYRLLLSGERLSFYGSELKAVGIDPKMPTPAVLDEGTGEALFALLLKRAKKRAMHLLEVKGRTSRELYDRLIRDEYGAETASAALAYVTSFGYVNDREYIRSFILGRSARKSKKELVYILRQKGLDKELIEEVADEILGDASQQDTIMRILEKKGYGQTAGDSVKRQKIMAYLARKGFGYDEIRRACDSMDANEEIDQ